MNVSNQLLVNSQDLVKVVYLLGEQADKIESTIDKISCCTMLSCLPCLPLLCGLKKMNEHYRGCPACTLSAGVAFTCCLPVCCLAVFCDQEEPYAKAWLSCIDRVNSACGIPPLNDPLLHEDLIYDARDNCDNFVYAICSGHYLIKRGFCGRYLVEDNSDFLLPKKRAFYKANEGLLLSTPRPLNGYLMRELERIDPGLADVDNLVPEIGAYISESMRNELRDLHPLRQANRLPVPPRQNMT